MSPKGSSLVIIGLTILCVVVVAQATLATPVVISATRVPVLGGIVHIYGHGFGTDASLLSVQIEDPEASGGTVACTDVAMITPNRVISCRLASVGTGKSMHITVTITESTDDNGGVETSTNDDGNTVFSREVPQLDSITYSVEEKTIVIQGSNFGFDVSKVTARLSGDDYPVLAVTNNAITLRFLRKRRTDGYIVPDTSLAHVTVDGQSNVANMTATRASLVMEPDTEDVSAGSQSGGGMDKGKVAGLAAGGALIFIVVSVFVAVFVMKRKRSEFKDELPNRGKKLHKKPETGRAHLETGRALNFALIGHQAEPGIDPEAPAVMQAMKQEPVEATANAEPLDAEAAAEVVAEHSEGEGEEGEEGHHSLEEIDLRDDDIYEKNNNPPSDSSFSESSDDDDDDDGDAGDDDDEFDRADGSSTFSAEFSDASPALSPIGEKRQQLQMSSEFPSSAMGMGMGSRLPSSRIEQAPSPPVLLNTKAQLPPSPLRRSMVIPALSLDDSFADSDGSPLPSPRNISPPAASSSKKGKKAAQKRGMIRVPSSRIASRVTMQKPQNAFDSPQL